MSNITSEMCSPASISSATQISRIKPKKPLDKWSTREKLCLASAVFKIGDQNWVSVSRAIKPFAEPNRQAEWFHQKNCVLQYYDMLEQLEQPKRKRGGDKSETDTPSLQIMRKMTIERSEQLKKEIVEMQQHFNQLKSDVDEIESGGWDDKLEDIWTEIQNELKDHSKSVEEIVKKEELKECGQKYSGDTDLNVGASDIEESDQDASSNLNTSLQNDDQTEQSRKGPTLTSTPIVKESPNKHKRLLSSLLESNVTTATGLQKLKREQEEKHHGESESTLDLDLKCSSQAGSIKTIDASPSAASDSTDKSFSMDSSVFYKSQPVEVTANVETVEIVSEIQSDKDYSQNTNDTMDELERDQHGIKTEPTLQEETADLGLKSKLFADQVKTDTDFTDSLVKEEPLSPSSSISSRISETEAKKIGRRGRQRGSSKGSRVPVKKGSTDECGSFKYSDVELSEDDVRDSEDLDISHIATHSSILSESSFPNSPASLSICSDTEEEKSFKQWKKSIMLVWREAATHKNANVFLHPVTDDIAPGYRSVVLRPMDLSTIKKNIETGVIRSTVEFQRDMMLMFTNAMMYNNSDHNVHIMARQMYDDVMQHIEMMLQTSGDIKSTRQSRRPDGLEKEEDIKKRRQSVDQVDGGKSKKKKV